MAIDESELQELLYAAPKTSDIASDTAEAIAELKREDLEKKNGGSQDFDTRAAYHQVTRNGQREASNIDHATQRDMRLGIQEQTQRRNFGLKK